MLKLFGVMLGLAIFLMAFQLEPASAQTLDPGLTAGKNSAVELSFTDPFTATVDLSRTTDITVSVEEGIFAINLISTANTSLPISGSLTYGDLDCGTVIFLDSQAFSLYQETHIDLLAVRPGYTKLQVFINKPNGMEKLIIVHIFVQPTKISKFGLG